MLARPFEDIESQQDAVLEPLARRQEGDILHHADALAVEPHFGPPNDTSRLVGSNEQREGLPPQRPDARKGQDQRGRNRNAHDCDDAEPEVRPVDAAGHDEMRAPKGDPGELSKLWTVNEAPTLSSDGASCERARQDSNL